MAGKQPPKSWIIMLVAFAAIAWNGVGAFDYFMTQTRNEDYMASFTPEQLAYFYGFPSWVVAAWALSVWSGVAGGVLLLIRSRFAFEAFAVSLAAFLATSVYSFALSDGAKIMGAGGLTFSAVIFLVAAALAAYARMLSRRGALR